MEKIALNRPSYTCEMLCDLISKLKVMTWENRDRVWAIIDTWYNEGSLDDDIAKIRDKIRVTLLSSHAHQKIMRN